MDSEVLDYLYSLWLVSADSDAPGVLKDELVRVELADTLAQANRNDTIQLDSTQLLDFLRSQVEASDPSIRQRALPALGGFDDPLDVPV